MKKIKEIQEALTENRRVKEETEDRIEKRRLHWVITTLEWVMEIE